MLVAHLIGGNEIQGISNGKVIINGVELRTSYAELAQVCGNISLGDLDTSIHGRRTSEDVLNDYIELVKDFDEAIPAEFIITNFLTHEISYSTYEVDMKNQTLILKIETYN